MYPAIAISIIFPGFVPGVSLRNAAGKGGDCHGVATALIFFHQHCVAHPCLFYVCIPIFLSTGIFIAEFKYLLVKTDVVP